MSDDSIFPPERFANLMRDAGINSPEALMNMLRGNAQSVAPESSAMADAADAPASHDTGAQATPCTQDQKK